MRTAVDLRVTQGTRTGVGTIAYYQMKHVLAVDKANSYFGILLENEASDLRQNPALTVWPTRISGSHHFRRDLWQQAYLPYKLAREGIDVFHANYGIPVFARCATVVTVHDMNPFLFSYTNPGLSAWYAKRLIAASARAATRVIADSESAKDDVVRILKLPPEKVKVVYSATDGRFSGEAISEAAQQRVREKYGISKDFILFVGAFNPRKNLSRLLQAFRLLLDRHHLNCQLVLVGKKGWLHKDIFHTYESLGFGGEVIFTGYIHHNDPDLPALYAAATVTAYPSLYEGFGLPPLESMACGTPVVASNISSIPEVVGDAAVMIDPYDTDAMVDALREVLTEPSLRGELAARGSERVKVFSWERAARETIAIYEEAYQAHRGTA